MSVQLPVGATLARTDAITQQALDIILTTPGVWATSTYAGIDGNGFNNQSSSTQLWAIFDPFEERLRTRADGGEDHRGSARSALR